MIPPRAWLVAQRERIEAGRTFERLKNGELTDIHPERLFEVVLSATGDKRLADEYRVNLLRARQRPPAADPLE